MSGRDISSQIGVFASLAKFFEFDLIFLYILVTYVVFSMIVTNGPLIPSVVNCDKKLSQILPFNITSLLDRLHLKCTMPIFIHKSKTIA